MKRLPLELVLIWSLLCLAFVYSLQTLCQTSIPFLPMLSLFIPFIYFRRQISRMTLPSKETAIALMGVLLWLYFSGYIPWRDNDAFQMWMPKAKALALFGYLPAHSPDSPLHTLHPSYPLTYLGFSALLHSRLSTFYPQLHQLCFACISFLLWLCFDRWHASQTKLRMIWKVLFVACVFPQLPIWSNGYHDIQWAFALCLGFWMAYQKWPTSHWLPVFYWGCLGKSESLVMGVLLLVILAWKQSQKLKCIGYAIPLILWPLTCLIRGFSSELQLLWHSQQSLTHILSLISEETSQLLLFRTFHGTASCLLLLSILIFFLTRSANQSGMKKNIPFFAAFFLIIYISIYYFSSIDPAWHIRFSWPRLLYFPCIFFIGSRLLSTTSVWAAEPH